MKKIILSLTGALTLTGSFAQNPSDDTEHKLVYGWGGKFHVVDEHGYRVRANLNKASILELMSQTPNGTEMYSDYARTVRTSKILSTSSAVTAVAGLGLIFAGIDFKNEELRPGLFWTGVGLEGVALALGISSIPVSFVAKNKGKKVSSYYNSSTGRQTLNIGATRNGIGLVYKF